MPTGRTCLFGLRELGRETLFAFGHKHALGLDLVATFASTLSASSPERTREIIEKAWRDDDGKNDLDELFTWLHGEQRYGATFYLREFVGPRRAPAIVVVDLDHGAASFSVENGRPLRFPWSQLAAVAERAGSIAAKWHAMNASGNRIGRVEDVDDCAEPSLRPFFFTFAAY